MAVKENSVLRVGGLFSERSHRRRHRYICPRLAHTSPHAHPWRRPRLTNRGSVQSDRRGGTRSPELRQSRQKRPTTGPGAITIMTLMTPQDDNSRHTLPWMTKIAEQLDMGWTTIYSDRTGREHHTASACASHSRRTSERTSGHQYLGTAATVADAERTGLLRALQDHYDDHAILLLTDSQAAVDTVRNHCQGQAPRSGIEQQLKAQLSRRHRENQGTTIAWFRSHIGIPGNEEADSLATWSSHLGQTTGATRTVTEGGLRASTARQSEHEHGNNQA